jgi:hypothetical protein
MIYLLSLRAYYVGFFNDDAFYLIGARSLLSGGFRELNAPGSPPLVNYLPGYPLLLAQWSWLVGPSTLSAQLLSVGLSVASVGLMWRLLAAELEPAVAFAAVAVTGFNTLTVSMSGTVLSDIPFFLMTLLVFIAARSTWGRQSPASWAGLGALAGCAFLVRPTGAVFGLALVLCLLGERRWVAAAWAAAGAAAVPAPWLWRNYLVSGRLLSHASELAAPWGTGGALRALWERLARNVPYYGTELFWRAWFRWPLWSGGRVLERLTVTAGLIATGMGLRAWGLKGWRKFLTVYGLLYVALHLELHLQSDRYILTFFPMAAPLFFLGLSVFERRSGFRKIVLGAAALSLALSVAPVVNVVRTSLWRHTPVNTPPLETLAWIRSHTSPTDVFAAELDGRLYLLSERRTVRLRKLYEPEVFGAWLRGAGVDYVLVAPTDYFMTTVSGGTSHDPMDLGRLKALLAYGPGYQRVFSAQGEGTEIFQVISGAAASD